MLVGFVLLLLLTLAGVVYLCVSFCRQRCPASADAPAADAHTRPHFPASLLPAVLLSLLLFCAYRTAAEGRIGLGASELFSLWSDGVPRLGQTAVSCLLVLASFALFFTSAGRRLRQTLTAACDKDWCRWVLSAVVTGLFLLWLSRVTVCSFMTNDDTSILRTIAAVPEEGLSYASSTFSNIVFCGFLSLFYRLNPDGYWYAGYHLAALSFSIVVIGRCILLKTGKRRWPALVACLIQLSLCCMLAYTFAELSFTVTPAVVGSAAIALILCRGDTDSVRSHVLSDILSVLLMLLCVTQRWSTGMCLLCFWALASVYQALKIVLSRDPKWKGLLCRFGICILAVIALTVACKQIDQQMATQTDSDYATAEYYRSIVMDYLIGDLSDEQLEAVGIPSELSWLLRQWYFMDERINTETFKKIVDLYYTPTTTADSNSTLVQTVFSGISALFTDIVSSNYQLLFTVSIFCLLCICAATWILLRQRYWPEFLCSFCGAGGFLLLSLYLVIQGRFPLRVFLVTVIPALIITLLMALSAPTGNPTPGKRRAMIAVASVVSLATFLCSLATLYSVPYITGTADRQSVFGEQWELEDYVNSHENMTFITNFTRQNLDPFHGGTYPSNMRLWGGTGVTASSSRLYADAFFEDDVQFMCTPLSTALALIQYLTLDNGPVQALMVYQFSSGIGVYDISQVTPGDDYTGWYEQNGMTYYFVDGQAVTGTQVIDGVEYEFAPTGAEAKLAPQVTEDGLLYTTNAYSLISNGD